MDMNLFQAYGRGVLKRSAFQLGAQLLEPPLTSKQCEHKMKEVKVQCEQVITSEEWSGDAEVVCSGG